MLDARLIKKINRGTCFALIGSGPSSQLGYPSWQKLAELTYEKVSKSETNIDHEGYKKFLLQRKFASVFELAQRDLGGRHQLVDFLKIHLQADPKATDQIYEILVRWPFACYLTTNWDDEIQAHLRATDLYYTVLQNTVGDLTAIRADARNLVVKLHSDLDHSDNAVITSSDYQKYEVEGAYDYFRKKIRSIFEIFDILIVGHSLSDPDLSYILRCARELGRPEHPVFMLAADVTEAERDEYLQQYNISIVAYRNDDGRHGRLRRLLNGADPFIRARLEHAPTEHYDVPEHEVEAASSLFLYTRLDTIAQKTEQSQSRLLEPLVLAALDGPVSSRGPLEEYPSIRPVIASLSNPSQILKEAVAGLLKAGLVSHSGGSVTINKTGEAALRDIRAARALQEKQAFAEFEKQLRKDVPTITDAAMSQCYTLFREAVVGIFRRRGISIANSIFANQPTSGDDLSDIFGVLSASSAKLGQPDVAAAFVDAAHAFLIRPSTEQRNYLASISQGFFLYHLLGQDPTGSKIRRDLFGKTFWIIDSSVLIPFAASGCHNHQYAVDLLHKLAAVEGKFFATSSLLREVLEHFDWARSFAAAHPVYSPEFLEAALARLNYKQNLFLDGFVRTAAEGRVSTFSEYVKQLFPSGATHESIKKSLVSHGLRIVDLSDLTGFDQLEYGEQLAIEEAVRSERQTRHSFRSDLQVKAEAEVFQMVRRLGDGSLKMPNHSWTPERVYFVSQSRVLDSISTGTVVTWSPESVYRYMTALPGNSLDPSLLQQCMLNDYYNAGVSFIDTERYERFFMPYINVAKADFREHKKRYFEYIQNANQVENEFDATPDLDKPLFVQQMMARVAKTETMRADAATKRAEEAEARLRALESEKAAAWKTRERIRAEQLEAEKRNLSDPAHVRKRARQAARRAKKGKRR